MFITCLSEFESGNSGKNLKETLRLPIFPVQSRSGTGGDISVSRPGTQTDFIIMVSKNNKKVPFYFRRTPYNTFTLPVLFNTLEQGGWDRYFDFRVIADIRSLANMEREIPPGILAYSFMTSQMPRVLNEIARLRKRPEEKPLLLAGGTHVKGNPEQTLRMGFDAAAAGPGEILLPRICRILLEDPDRLRGIFRAGSEVDLDKSLPVSRTISLIPPLEITRGCHYRCRYCQTGSQRAVHRSPESVEAYLEALSRREYIFRVGYICPSGFEYGAVRPGHPVPEAIEDLLRRTREKGFHHVEFGIFPSEVRPETVTPRLLNLIRRICSNRKLCIGAQTGSDKQLRFLRRGHSLEAVHQAAAYTQESGLTPVIDFILGIPGETGRDQENVLQLMKQLNTRYKARNQVHYFLPLAGTPLENSDSAPLVPATIDCLKKYQEDGICTGWWREGLDLSRQIREAKKIIRAG
jgi:B12-binding domain/radical SAM domain protein